MNRKRFSPRNKASYCGQLQEDDGIDPAEYFRPERKRNQDQRKALQLCHQVADTLSLVISDERDDELRELRVVAVTPAPDTSQLMVLVTPVDPESKVAPSAVVDKLTAAAGRLRAEVAAAITRRRAPRLLFQFIAAQSLGEVAP